jgi:hypothetical protein
MSGKLEPKTVPGTLKWFPVPLHHFLVDVQKAITTFIGHSQTSKPFLLRAYPKKLPQPPIVSIKFSKHSTTSPVRNYQQVRVNNFAK